MKQKVKRTKEQAAMSKIDPSIRPSSHDRQQYAETTFLGRGKAKAPPKGY